MQTESNVKPSERFILENYVDGMVDIVFFDEIKEETKEEFNMDTQEKQTIYKYNMYRVTKRNREGLKADVEKNYQTYLESAKKAEYEILASKIREKRDKLLLETDKYLLEDFPISADKKEKYKIYRNALREVPEQQGFPYDVCWPVKE